VPGQYFVLQIDFSALDRYEDRNVARHRLNAIVNVSISKFYRTYEPYLRMSADSLIRDLIKDDAAASMAECANVVHNILGSVKSPEDPLSMIKGVRIKIDMSVLCCVHRFHMRTVNNLSFYIRFTSWRTNMTATAVRVLSPLIVLTVNRHEGLIRTD